MVSVGGGHRRRLRAYPLGQDKGHLEEDDVAVHIFTDDPEYADSYRFHYALHLRGECPKVSINLEDDDIEEGRREAMGHQMFVRATSVDVFLQEAVIMGLCDQIYVTAGSTVYWLMESINSLWADHYWDEVTVIGDWKINTWPPPTRTWCGGLASTRQ